MDGNRTLVPLLEPGTLYAERYRIVAQIGRGGMGRVYLTEDIRLNGKKRALKLSAASADERELFIREARILTELQHPHLPGIVDYYAPDERGWAAIVMEYIAGDTLAELFVRCGFRLPFAKVLHYLQQLCGLLGYLHGRNPQIVFRDLKPANVLIDRHDRAVLVDFGIARAYRSDALADTERLGTPAFAAPEQWSGGQTDARTDLYGWGALAYYLLSGGQLACRLSGSVRQRLQPDVPAGFCDLLERVLSVHPEDRPQNAQDLKRQLQEIVSVPLFGAEFSAGGGQKHAERADGMSVAAVLSAYPGAGATFASIGLSAFLSAQGISHALVECPGGEPEMYGLLDGVRTMPRHAVFADPSGEADTVPAWNRGRAFFYPLVPGTSSRPPDAGFSGWLRRLGVPLILLDVSNKWELPGMAGWLTDGAVQSLWWLADCLPAKWSPRRQSAAAELQQTAAGRGIVCGWIANRDHAFSERGEWLSCFPEVPAARLPLMPADAVIRAAWTGEGYPSDPKFASASDRAFQMWAKAVIVSQGR